MGRHLIASVLLLGLGTLVPLTAWGQRGALEQGIPLGRSFTPREYNGHAQNWAIAQAPSGMLYVANTGTLLEYNGVSWRGINVGGNILRAVAAGPDGRVYVGGDGVFGVVSPDSAGFYQFRSLLPRFPKEALDAFRQVWHLFAYDEYLYINTGTHIVRLRGEEVRVWPSASGGDDFHTAFVVNGVFYVRQFGVGLQRLRRDALELVPGGELFAQPANRIDAMVPFGDGGGVLIATRTLGTLLFQDGGLRPFPTELDAAFAQYSVYHGAALGQGLYGFATRGGFFVLNQQGRQVHHITTGQGLPSDLVRYVFPDQQGSTWLAMEGGLARLEYPSPLTRFDQTSGLKGTLWAVARHAGQLYVGGGGGLYRLETSPEGTTLFAPVPGLRDQVWDLLPVGDLLLVATTNGLYSLDGKGRVAPQLHTPDRIAPGEDPIYYSLLQDPDAPSRVYAGKQRDGILELRVAGGKCTLEGSILPVLEDSRQVRYLVADPAHPRMVWFGNETFGIHRVDLRGAEPQFGFYGPDQGLPNLTGCRLYRLGSDLFATSPAGVYRYAEADNRFVPDARFGSQLLADSLATFVLAPASEGKLWLTFTPRGGDLRLQQLEQVSADRYRILATPVNRLRSTVVRDVLTEPDGTSWIATDLDGLLRYDGTLTKPIEQAYTAWVLNVVANDSLQLYGGAFLPNGDALPTAPVDFEYGNRSLRFSFGSLAFDADEATLYRTRLVPFDTKWSPLSRQTSKDYTNLPPGTFTFEVEAVNAYGLTGGIGSYRFTLLPPWYLTWWAFTLYGIGLVGLVVGGAVGYNRYQTAKLEARNRELEAIVTQRTAEVVAQKNAIEQANAEITAKNAELGNAYEEIRAQNENLEMAYHLIEEKNRDITDSIQYASRIQRAFLPDIVDIRKVFPNAFVMLMPRDIVSGDYYWFGRRDDYVLLAGADCTGHGVPGAFMSMMGNTLLHQIVSEGVVHPGEVLDVLDQKVKFNLRQFDPNSKTNDGMEVMLWTVNLATRQLMYASASRPMIHIRGGVLTEIKAEKVPIGGAQYRDHRGFEAHAFPYEPGDWVYTFSDGFPDQFGGEHGRKYMIKRAKELLLEIHHLPAEEQEAIVRKEMTDWMGPNYEQTDDILVIGFQLP